MLLMPLVLALAAGATIKPRFSWDTVQPFIHFANTSGPFSDESIAIMATFPMVTIEKFQGPCAAKSKPPTDSCGQEKLIIDTLRRVKQANSTVCTIFYFNSILNFPQYDLSARFMENNASLCLRTTAGDLVYESGGGKGGLTVFDYTQPAACDLWASECINATNTGYVDGCFADRAIDVQKFETDGSITPEKREAFDKCHWDMLAKLQKSIGDGPIIANHAYNLTGVGGAMIEFAKANVDTVKNLQASAQNKKVVQCHFGKQLNDDVVATFLIGAGEFAYIGAGGWSISGGKEASVSDRWYPQYFERPLGTPLTDAVVSTDGKTQNFTRSFSKGTNVSLFCDEGTCKGKIEWAGAPPTPTPAPSPAPQPTATCPMVESACSWQHSDLDTKKGSDWSSCCSACHSHTDCTKWVYRSGEGSCRLHGAGAAKGGAVDGNVCGVITRSV